MGRYSTLPQTVYPRVVIVTERQRSATNDEAAAREKFLSVLREETIGDGPGPFPAIKVLSIFPPGEMSSRSRHRRLRECLLNESDKVRVHRIQSKTLFLATHFAAFFRFACDHFATMSTEPFDFIRTSRYRYPVSTELGDHLKNFLAMLKSTQELTEFATPMIASCLFLDSYPPEMHVFNSTDVFRTLYRDACNKASRSGVLVHEGSATMILPSGFVKMIEAELAKRVMLFTQNRETTSAQTHEDILKNFQNRWPLIHNSATCLVCLQRKPEYGLPCRHSVCENCIRIFGSRNDEHACSFLVYSCFLCGFKTPGLTVKVKPPTAGVRVLSIDGGGVRGVVPLVFLELLEKRIGLPCPIQEFFDACWGTSSGAMIILAMFVNGWSVEECSRVFESLSKPAFQRRTFLRIPLLSHIQECLMSYLADSLYAADNLEEALQETFGDRSLLDCSYATTIGAKIGVTATTISDLCTCVFTNYNRAGFQSKRFGYHIVEPEDGRSSVLVWEAARCSSAAPLFFRPKCIPGVGTFQDGGVWRNNPVDIAVWEIRAIWPEADEPDFVVSLGTGYRQQPPNTLLSMSGPRGIWRDGFIPRLRRACVQAFMSCMNGREIWRGFRAHRPRSGGRCFRLDLETQGEIPRLDDINGIQELKTLARAGSSGSGEIDVLARCAVSSLFYFELESTPEYADRQYSCTGNILCRLRADSKAFEALVMQLSKNSAKFFLGNHRIPGQIGDRSSLGKGGDFRKRVELRIGDLQSKLSIYLKEGRHEQQNISGSPFSISTLVAAQGLDAYFGRADHRKRKPSDNSGSPKTKRLRR
ncbi:MAG: hypothetical protein M1840_001465 [Geoglossum simile]|nr:MAG: hypothetical protein M1840_001465 [Geoglossum simile]